MTGGVRGGADPCDGGRGRDRRRLGESALAPKAGAYDAKEAGGAEIVGDARGDGGFESPGT